jgi:nesprin-1
VAFLTLTESKLKNWTVKYGPEEKVQQIMNQYRTFVSKNKIFQEFQKAYVEFVQVCDEYKKDGDISKRNSN